jgi:hypothetical protein
MALCGLFLGLKRLRVSCSDAGKRRGDVDDHDCLRFRRQHVELKTTFWRKHTAEVILNAQSFEDYWKYSVNCVRNSG